MSKKIIIIGGGPGGYTAAIRASQMGAEAVLVEADNLGGTCLNIGCVPTKTLLHMAETYRKARSNAIAGVNIGSVDLDIIAAMQHKEDVIQRLSTGVYSLLRSNRVRVIKDRAIPLSARSVKIGLDTFECDAVILAVGSVNAPLAIPGYETTGIMDSTKALSMEKLPESMIIIGGGVVGIEFAELYNSLGVNVRIIEIMQNLLPSMDIDISEYLQMIMEERNISINVNTGVDSIKRIKNGFSVSCHNDDKKEVFSAEGLLIATGRKANVSDLGLAQIGVAMTKGSIDTDEHNMTNIPGIYAIGDCNGRTMLAHAAMAQGEIAVEHIMNGYSSINSNIIPSCVYTSPEIASVGMTEQDAQLAGLEYNVGRFDLFGNARAIIEDSNGFVKIIADKKYGEVLGVHIVAPYATEMIGAASLCMNMEGTVEDIVNSIQAHPTVSESIREAALRIRS